MGMMGGGMGVWLPLWILLGVVAAGLVAAGAIFVAHALGGRRHDGPRQVGPAESPGVAAARDALRMRYAHGEISREEYLQGKVELED
jgi:putative membrane protein